jgi:tRNA 2-thiouridine synthesizing protein A
VTTTLDLTGVVCPMNWVRARLALEVMQPGERLELVLDPGEPLDSVPRSAREDGHGVSVDGERVTIVVGGGA